MTIPKAIHRRIFQMVFVLAVICYSNVVMGKAPDLRTQISLNGNWKCLDTEVVIPEYFGENYTGTRVYTRQVTVPETWKNKIIMLEFTSIVHKAVVYVNNRKVTEHVGGWAPFQVDVSKLVQPAKPFELKVEVTGSDALKEADGKVFFPVGGWIGKAGISDDVFLRAYGNVSVRDAFVKTSVAEKTLTVDYTLVNSTGKAQTIALEGIVMPESQNDPAHRFAENIRLLAGETKLVSIRSAWTNPELYWPDRPVMYNLQSQVKINGKIIDQETRRFGFREIAIKGNQIYWNNVRINLFGSYETYADDWYGLTKQIHSKENFPETADKMLAMNIRCVRWHHNPVPAHILDICDEKGLLVCSESPNYARDFHKGMTPETIEKYIQNFIEWSPAWIKVERNHPAIYQYNVTNEKTHTFCEKLSGEQCKRMGVSMRQADPTRFIGYDGDVPASEELVNYHYPEGYDKQPVGSIYSWAKFVKPNQPTGTGEVLHAKKPESAPETEKYHCERNKWWMGIWMRGLRYTNWTDVRPACFWFAADDLENCDPKVRVRGENLRNAYAPVALFDKEYDDLGIRPFVWNLTPGGTFPGLQAGETAHRTLVIYNDEFSNREVTVELRLQADGNVLASATKTYKIELGEHFDIPYSFTVPETKGKLLELVLLTRKGNVKKFEETKNFTVTTGQTNSPDIKISLGEIQNYSVPTN